MTMVMSCTFPVLISHSYDFLLKCLLEDLAHFSTDILTIFLLIEYLYIVNTMNIYYILIIYNIFYVVHILPS